MNAADCKRGRPYIFSEIRKDGNTRRPIVSTNDIGTENTVSFFTYPVKELPEPFPSYIENRSIVPVLAKLHQTKLKLYTAQFPET